MTLTRLPTVDSTQRVAREFANAGAPHGTAVLAEEQTAGRGTRGRTWSSPPGENLYLSVILRPRGPARDAALLGLGAAAAMAEDLGLMVKWPNDLVTPEGRKVAGLLAEMETQGASIRHVVMGVGINVNQQVFPPDLPFASSLAILRGGTLDREAVLQVVLAAIRDGAEAPDRLDRWRRHARTLGQRVRVGSVVGIATDIREDGALLIDGVAVVDGLVEVVG